MKEDSKAREDHKDLREVPDHGAQRVDKVHAERQDQGEHKDRKDRLDRVVHKVRQGFQGQKDL